jgi:hypothetical protein
MDSEDLGRKILKKYPEYNDMIETPEPEIKNRLAEEAPKLNKILSTVESYD